MQSIEAILSLVFFLAISSQLLLVVREEHYTDDSLYRIQLAQDAWRVLSLRGTLQDFDENGLAKTEADIKELGEQTSLCMFLGGIRSTNCRDQNEHPLIISLTRTVIIQGEPKSVTFSIRN